MDGDLVSLVAVRCRACGGAVAMKAGHLAPQCLFCGADAPVPEEMPTDAVPPELSVAFRITASEAQEAFQDFATSRWLHPGDLRNARVELSQLLFPAWLWSGEVEHHYAGLARAATRSGKRPETGTTLITHEAFPIPASQTLNTAELVALAPFPCEHAHPFDPSKLDVPFELGSLSLRAAHALATQRMHQSDTAQIAAATGLSRLRSSCLFHDLVGRPLLLPIWIGAYRYKDTAYRVVINGETGTLTGKGPIAWSKLIALLLAVMVAFTLAAALLGSGGGGALPGPRP